MQLGYTIGQISSYVCNTLVRPKVIWLGQWLQEVVGGVIEGGGQAIGGGGGGGKRWRKKKMAILD